MCNTYMPSADKHVPFEMNAWRSGLRGVHSKLTMPLSDMLGLSHFIHTTYHKHARYGARQHPSPSAVQVRQLVVAHDESCAERRHHAASRGALCHACLRRLPVQRQRCRSFTARRTLGAPAPAVPVFHGPQGACGEGGAAWRGCQASQHSDSGAGLPRPADCWGCAHVGDISGAQAPRWHILRNFNGACGAAPAAPGCTLCRQVLDDGSANPGARIRDAACSGHICRR